MKNKKVLAVLIMIMMLSTFCVTLEVKADSGWDSSYSSGSSSSWDSGSSWDSSSSSSSSGGGSHRLRNYTKAELIRFFIVVFASTAATGIFLYLFTKIAENLTLKSQTKSYNKKMRKYEEEKLRKINNREISTEEILKYKVFDIYKAVQEAWMNFDYDALKKLTSSELYNMYESQLKVLSTKEQQNIMQFITNRGCKIDSIQRVDNKEIVTATLKIKMYDFVINKKKKVVQGSKDIKLNIEYKIVLEKTINTIDNCPHCGAKLNNSATEMCPACGTKIVNNNDDYVLTYKQAIEQYYGG